MTGAEDPWAAWSRLMVLLPAVWTVACLMASRGLELWSRRTPDDAMANIRAKRAQNLQDFSRIMPTPLLVVFAIGLLWECVRLLPHLF